LIRPNQLLAVSLGDSPLSAAVQREVVQVAIDELLTPVGLRTLARGEPGYQPRCAGPRWQRDAAYHQGTVWAWLMGPFIEAYLRVNGFSETAKKQAGRWIQPLIEHLNHSGCLGQISEIFDGDEPHAPRGAFAQAWSVAEVLRAVAMIR
jgi:glycogen debranching enzyme